MHHTKNFKIAVFFRIVSQIQFCDEGTKLVEKKINPNDRKSNMVEMNIMVSAELKKWNFHLH